MLLLCFSEYITVYIVHKIQKQPSSFRDPSGFLFHADETLYRQVNTICQTDYDLLMSSGLYDALVEQGFMVGHVECELSKSANKDAYKIIKPEVIPFISYPYEWSFSQLLDAAALTLKVQLLALKHGMILKDASAYNVQFLKGRAIFIDTLSFTAYQSGPWVAYKQFCQHFFAPLCLLQYTDRRLLKLSQLYLDGVPLDLASSLLPVKTWFKYSVLVNVHLHAKSQAYYADGARDGRLDSSAASSVKVGEKQLKAIVEQLQSAVDGFKLKAGRSEWGDYYDDTNYQDESQEHKKNLVQRLITQVSSEPSMVYDVGANNGYFSRLAAKTAKNVISFDIDEVAVDKNFQINKLENIKNILPLILDLTNPSPAIGWANKERESAVSRCGGDIALALALVHHLAISNNIPLSKIAKVFSQMAENLIIEFVPKGDSQVDRLLASREDIFPEYNEIGFEQAFAHYFEIECREHVEGSARVLYRMKRKG